MSIPPFEALTTAQLRARASRKWHFYGPDVLPLWVAEMDVLPAPEVSAAITKAACSGDLGYDRQDGQYAEAFGAFAQLRWGWAPEPADTLTCVDVMTGIRELIYLLSPPDGLVIVPSPAYPPLRTVPTESGRVVESIAHTLGGRLDLTAIRAALESNEKPAIILLSNPQNPTGAVHSAAELLELALIAQAGNAIVISDEVHAPLTAAQITFTPWLSISESGFAVTSAAKAFNLAGLKAALILAGPQSREALRSLPQHVLEGTSLIGVIGHSAAYLSDPTWLDAVVANIASNHRLLGELLANHLPWVPHRAPESTYLAWLDLTGSDLGTDPAPILRARAQVALTGGQPFGPGGAGHVRVNVACPAAVLTEAVERIARVIQQTQ